MKVIYIKDYKQNKKDSVKEEANGFAVNFLIKKGYAIKATEQNLAELEKKQKSVKEKEDNKIKAAKALAESIEKTPLSLRRVRGKNDLMQGSVTKNILVNEYKERFNIELDKKSIELNKINTFGEHKIKIKIYKDIVATLTLNIL